MPKGHIEQGETAEQTAIREVADETGIQGSVLIQRDRRGGQQLRVVGSFRHVRSG